MTIEEQRFARPRFAIDNPSAGQSFGGHSNSVKQFHPPKTAQDRLEWKAVPYRAKAWILIFALAGFGLRLATPLVTRAGTPLCCCSQSCCHASSCPMHARTPTAAKPQHHCHEGAQKAAYVTCTCSLHGQAPAGVLVTAQQDFRFQLPSACPAPELRESGHSDYSHASNGLQGHTSPPDQPPRAVA
jgi:hypothetical protein